MAEWEKGKTTEEKPKRRKVKDRGTPVIVMIISNAGKKGGGNGMPSHKRTKELRPEDLPSNKSPTAKELQRLIDTNNAEYGTKFSLGGAYGQQELWDERRGERIESGSKKDIYEAFIRERFKEKRRE